MTRPSATLPLPRAESTSPGLQLLESTARIDVHSGLTLYRVKATKSRWDGLIPAGMIGGWLTTLENLGDDAWVDEFSEVVGEDARVLGSALVCEYSRVSGDAMLSGDSSVRRSVAMGTVHLSGNATARDCVLSGSVQLLGDATVMRSTLGGKVIVRGGAELTDCDLDGAEIFEGNVRFAGDASTLD